MQIKHLGRGNTAGDAIVYLPKEKILITGDLLDHPVPYLSGGYPSELITILQSIAQLDAETIVPGHGRVLHDKSHLYKVIDFVRIVVSEVSKEVHRLGSSTTNFDRVQESVLKAIDVEAWRQSFAGDDKADRDFFDGFSVPGLIKASFAETWRK